MDKIILPFGLLALLFPSRGTFPPRLYQLDKKSSILTVWQELIPFNGNARCPFCLIQVVSPNVLWYNLNDYYVNIYTTDKQSHRHPVIRYDCCIFKKELINNYIEGNTTRRSIYSLWWYSYGTSVYDAYRRTIRLAEK